VGGEQAADQERADVAGTTGDQDLQAQADLSLWR
jgi:hypothetical protein